MYVLYSSSTKNATAHSIESTFRIKTHKSNVNIIPKSVEYVPLGNNNCLFLDWCDFLNINAEVNLRYLILFIIIIIVFIFISPMHRWDPIQRMI